ncbi:MAG: cytochrome c biogenesis protein CcsA [Fimbriimonadaceae bacterium]|nr:cytochrome c biogenesis protein CcsA [Fimbriimonadaceae bacterium]
MTLLAQLALGSWIAGSAAYLTQKKRAWIGDVLMMLGILSGVLFLGILWASLGRPPLRTLGETRWWYAVGVPVIGCLIGWRFQTRALAVPSCLMGALFAWINLAHPETMDKTLMPALQSPWFVPHVIVYMVSYSALGLGSLMAAWVLVKRLLRREEVQPEDADTPHRLVLVGLPLLTCGLLFGAFWAKEAWGHYWTWDPKETWAFLTWAAYLTYLHVRQRHQLKPVLALSVLVAGFAVLLGCWFGVNLLPTAQESVHTYTRTE